MSMSNHEISVAADKAADYIEEYGHTKRTLQTRGGSACCINGALLKVADYRNRAINIAEMTPFVSDEFYKLTDTVRDYIGCDGSIVRWNNAEERTQEEVVQVLRDVATKYRDDVMHG